MVSFSLLPPFAKTAHSAYGMETVCWQNTKSKYLKRKKHTQGNKKSCVYVSMVCRQAPPNLSWPAFHVPYGLRPADQNPPRLWKTSVHLVWPFSPCICCLFVSFHIPWLTAVSMFTGFIFLMESKTPCYKESLNTTSGAREATWGLLKGHLWGKPWTCVTHIRLTFLCFCDE